MTRMRYRAVSCGVFLICAGMVSQVHAASASLSLGRERMEIPVNNALLIEFYDELAAGRNVDRFIRKVKERYTEGTLQRLSNNPEAKVRQAALVALGLTGTMKSNDAVAACLSDDVQEIRETAENTLWAIWFRGDSAAHSQELQRMVGLVKDEEYAKALKGLNALIDKAPGFAEAYNQRAILYWNWGEFKKSILDCERVLKLNPHHFGAQSGMAQCYLRLEKPDEALKAYRQLRKIYPAMRGIEEQIHELEMLLKEGRRGKHEK